MCSEVSNDSAVIKQGSVDRQSKDLVHPNNLNKTLKVVEELENNQCKECSEICASSIDLIKHVIYKHPKSKNQEQCEQCNRKFHTIIDLDDHFKLEHKTLDIKSANYFYCQECDYKSILKRDLIKHLITKHRKRRKELNTLRIIRRNALKTIVKHLGEDFTINDIKTKMHNLRSQLWHELEKVRKSRNTGEEIYVPIVWWFDKIQFLVPHTKIGRLNNRSPNVQKIGNEKYKRLKISHQEDPTVFKIIHKDGVETDTETFLKYIGKEMSQIDDEILLNKAKHEMNAVLFKYRKIWMNQQGNI